MGPDFATNGEQTPTNPFAVYEERVQLFKMCLIMSIVAYCLIQKIVNFDAAAVDFSERRYKDVIIGCCFFEAQCRYFPRPLF